MSSVIASPAGESTLQITPPQKVRIAGFDFARAIAIAGMVAVHFILVLATDQGHTSGGATLLELLDGRAAMLFVILAGVGITLRARSATAEHNADKLRRVQTTLLRRGLFLLAAGFINLAIWPGDILRVYGVSLLLAPWLLMASNRRLLGVAALFIVVFIGLMPLFDYEQHWDWSTMTYRELWTADGLVRNLFYNGFRSIFPWTGLLLFGMWLGRLDFSSLASQRKLLAWGAGTWLAAEGISKLLVAALLHSADAAGGLDDETISALVGTGSMPPLPLFLLSSGGLSLAIIALSLMLTEARPNTAVVQAFVATGQLAFTWYMAHIVLGLGTIEALGLTGTQSASVALLAGMMLFGAALVVSWIWKCFARHGPLEWVMRVACG